MSALSVEQAVAVALAHHRAGRLAEAKNIYEQVIAFDPRCGDASRLLATLHCQLGHPERSIDLFHAALAVDPNRATTHSDLANAYTELGRLDDALRHQLYALPIHAEPAKVLSNLGTIYKSLGLIEQSLEAYREALKIDPALFVARDNFLLGLHYMPGTPPEQIVAESSVWNDLHARPLEAMVRPHENDRDPDRRLRVGYVSADFRNHAVSFFMSPLLRTFDRSAVAVYCYSMVRSVCEPDEVTRELMALPDVQWREIHGVSDADAAELIRGDRIDLLIDLSGHTAGNRLPLFARRPAPVQATFLGYPNTTGMTSIDFRLTDANADPPGPADALHSEKLIRLPDCGWCYTGHPDAPAVNDLPALRAGRVTFGCFNILPKMNDEVLALWARVMSAVPGSRLLLLAPPCSARERIAQQLARGGVAGDRVEFIDRSPHLQHLANYQRVDLALDPFPYHGTTTTCDAMWMGVPVIALMGQSHAARVSGSLLTVVRLADLATNTPAQYINAAASLATDLPRLAALRRGLRDRMARSPLGNSKAFSNNLESAYREMWRRWCNGLP